MVVFLVLLYKIAFIYYHMVGYFETTLSTHNPLLYMLSRVEEYQQELKEVTKMTETMTDETWNSKATLIQGWFDNHPDWEQQIELLAVPQLMAAASAKPESRDALYTAIRTCFADIADKPFRSGRGSTMPDAVLIARDAVLSAYHSAMVNLFNDNESVQTLEMRHGKSGGGNYTDASEFADDATSSRRQVLNKAYSDFTKNNENAKYLGDGETRVSVVAQATT